MTDLKVALVITGDGRSAKTALDQVGAAEKAVGAAGGRAATESRRAAKVREDASRRAQRAASEEASTARAAGRVAPRAATQTGTTAGRSSASRPIAATTAGTRRLEEAGEDTAASTRSTTSVAAAVRATGQAAVQAGRQSRAASAQTRAAGAEVQRAAVAQASAVREAGTAAAEAAGTVQRRSEAASATIQRGMRGAAQAEREATGGVRQLGQQLDQVPTHSSRALGAMRTLAAGVKREFAFVQGTMQSTMGRIAALGVGYKLGQGIATSAQMDRTMVRTRQMAGMTPAQEKEYRESLYRLGRDNGNDVAALTRGGDTLFASGLKYDAARATLGAIDRASAVSGADPHTLANAAVAGANVYGIDLTDSKAAIAMLDKMVVAGRAGRIELEDLSSVLPVVSRNAKTMGLDLTSSLAMLETASQVEADPSRAATMVDSGLRLFTNLQYMQEVSKGSGIRHLYFNAQGQRRTPEAVLGDLKTRYDSLKNDRERTVFMGRVAGKTDQDTRGWLALMLSGNNLATYRDIKQQTNGASNVVAGDLADNRNSATAAAGRVRNTLGQAMDTMAQPINQALATAGGYLLDDLKLSGGQMVAGALGAGVLGRYGGRFGQYGLGKVAGLIGGGADTLKNIAVGRSLQQATGVTPVYVTNWSGAPSNGGAEGGGISGAEPAQRPGRGWLAGGVAVAAAAGGIYAMYQTAKDYPETVAATVDDTDARRWRQGGRYDGLQPRDESRHLSEDEVRARQSVRAATPYASWYRTHRDQYRWYQEAAPQDDYRRFIAQEAAGGQPPSSRSTSPTPASTARALGALSDVSASAPVRWLLPQLAAPVAAWAQRTAQSLDPTAQGGTAVQNAEPMRQAAALFDVARRGLETLLGQPLRIEVTSDTPEIHARLNRQHERDARRGG